MKILAIQRAARFSPNSVEKDLAILQAVVGKLRSHDCEVTVQNEEAILGQDDHGHYDAVLTMGRLEKTQECLKTLSCKVVNTPEGVENCARCRLDALMSQIGTPKAPEEGSDGYWLKRGDAAAQSKDDVQYVVDKQELEQKIAMLKTRGISQYVVSAHVKGDLVKFYGVANGFFRFYYPTDDGMSKFGDEQRNGQAQHYPFDTADLQQQAERLAKAVGIEVYGGDCIVRADGSYCIIDFNDWPSFSRCREEAAEAIAALVLSNEGR